MGSWAATKSRRGSRAMPTWSARRWRPPPTCGGCPAASGGFRVTTGRGELDARQVVVATGSYHTTRVPAWATSISDRVLQLHSHDYRNPAALPHGGVLVVGSGQTGLQLAEELFEAGRRVHISVGSAGRIPRRYRGRDIFAWLVEVVRDGARHGVTLPTADQLPDPMRRFKPMPALTGRGGGHDTNLRRYAADGMTLAGRLTGADSSTPQYREEEGHGAARSLSHLPQLSRATGQTGSPLGVPRRILELSVPRVCEQARNQRSKFHVRQRCKLQKAGVQPLQLALRHRVEADIPNALLDTRALQPTQKNLGSARISDRLLAQAAFDLCVGRRLALTARCAAYPPWMRVIVGTCGVLRVQRVLGTRRRAGGGMRVLSSAMFAGLWRSVRFEPSVTIVARVPPSFCWRGSSPVGRARCRTQPSFAHL